MVGACDGRPPHALAAAGLVRTFQIPRVLTRMTVLENMMLAGTDQPGERLGAALYRPRHMARREREIREQARELLELIRLSRLADDYAGTLSGGQRKLLEFGRALMTRPRMILLDEPMAGVAPTLAIQLLEHIIDAAGDPRHDHPRHRARHGGGHGHQRPHRRHGRGRSHRRRSCRRRFSATSG